MLGLRGSLGFSLVAARGGCSPVAVHRLLIAVSSLVELGLLEVWASAVEAYRLSCSMACGIFPDQASNPCLLHCQADSLSPRHQGSPQIVFLNKFFLGTSFKFT